MKNLVVDYMKIARVISPLMILATLKFFNDSSGIGTFLALSALIYQPRIDQKDPLALLLLGLAGYCFSILVCLNLIISPTP